MKEAHNLTAALLRFFKKPNTVIFTIVALFVIISILVLRLTWDFSMQDISNNAIQLAQAAEVGFSKSDVQKLDENSSDLDKPEYKQIKNNLTELVRLNNNIRFAYLFALKNDKIYFMVDSEPPESPDYSPPGEEFAEATDVERQPFSDGKTLLTKPMADHWGTWVSVLVPMKDPDTGKVIAELGVDYPANEWYNYATMQVGHMGIVIIFLILLVFSFLRIVQKNKMLIKDAKKLAAVRDKLKESEELFRMTFEQSPIGIAIGNKYQTISNLNSMFIKIIGRTKEEFSTMKWMDITHPDDLPEAMDKFNKFITGQIDGYTLKKRYLNPDGSVVWVNMKIAPLDIGNKEDYNHLCIIEDITDRVKSEEELKESERSKDVLLSNLPGMAYRCSYDHEWTLQFVSGGCFELTGYKPESLLHNRDLSFNDLISPEYRQYLWEKWEEVLTDKSKLTEEYEIITASGEKKWVWEQGQGIYDQNGEVGALEGLIIDISKRKMGEDKIHYLNCHDYLTGLYNRRYFELEKQRLDTKDMLPLSVIIGDINGVRIINDAFGHAAGDVLIAQTANILSVCCRKQDVLSRTGGDEFSILLPNTDEATAYEILKKIQNACNEYNKNAINDVHYINLSLGYGLKRNADDSIDHAIREAEGYLYKRKLLEHKSSHSAIISSIKATMLEKSQETEKHEERLVILTKRVGKKLNLSEMELDELELLATLHDIGKVGIDDRILNKPGKLNDEEWAEMKKHPEIGYRIAMSTPELVSVADYILSHHERWDGEGYPQGLKGEEIPLLSRILSVIDAYDAMTQDRVYRKAMSQEEAIKEIRRNADLQFDPNITKIFLDEVLGETDVNTVA